jgi:tRNA(Arg) A34 adenosine deaminase TadA
MAISDDDVDHIRRCVELAREAVEAGDEPFGSVLVDADGHRLFEDRNRVGGGDATRHPELAIALWAVENLEPTDRAATTTYTSGEHCPMCAAAHAWVGLGRIVYAVSAVQLAGWLQEWDAPTSPVAPLPITTVAPGLVVEGPVDAVVDTMKALHHAASRGDTEIS